VSRTAEEVRMMQQGGVEAGMAQRVEDVMEKDPQLKHSCSFRTVNHPGCGATRHNRVCYTLSKRLSEIRRPSLLLGEHIDFVCKELLKMPEDEYVSSLLDNVFK
jgi:crotonobetainyl-CoA:carnitine CoA-transferase CaiB-like acyl-CoA transferase